MNTNTQTNKKHLAQNKQGKPVKKYRLHYVTVLEQLYLSPVRDFTITDLKHLNGSLYYLDYLQAFSESRLLSTCLADFGGRQVKLFEFPACFEEKIKSKIYYHFQRKRAHVRQYRKGYMACLPSYLQRC